MPKSFVVPFLIIFVIVALFAYRKLLTPIKPKQPVLVSQVQMSQMANATVEYLKDCGSYPNHGQGFKFLLEKPTDCEQWQGPYLKNAKPLDGWGREFIYQNENGEAFIWSYGADGKHGGESEDRDLILKVGEGYL